MPKWQALVSTFLRLCAFFVKSARLFATFARFLGVQKMGMTGIAQSGRPEEATKGEERRSKNEEREDERGRDAGEIWETTEVNANIAKDARDANDKEEAGCPIKSGMTKIGGGRPRSHSRQHAHASVEHGTGRVGVIQLGAVSQCRFRRLKSLRLMMPSGAPGGATSRVGWSCSQYVARMRRSKMLMLPSRLKSTSS